MHPSRPRIAAAAVVVVVVIRDGMDATEAKGLTAMVASSTSLDPLAHRGRHAPRAEHACARRVRAGAFYIAIDYLPYFARRAARPADGHGPGGRFRRNFARSTESSVATFRTRVYVFCRSETSLVRTQIVSFRNSLIVRIRWAVVYARPHGRNSNIDVGRIMLKSPITDCPHIPTLHTNRRRECIKKPTKTYGHYRAVPEISKTLWEKRLT